MIYAIKMNDSKPGFTSNKLTHYILDYAEKIKKESKQYSLWYQKSRFKSVSRIGKKAGISEGAYFEGDKIVIDQ